MIYNIERKPYQLKLVFTRVLYPDRFGIWKWWFIRLQKIKTQTTGRKTSKQDENQQQTQSPWWEASTITTAPSLFPIPAISLQCYYLMKRYVKCSIFANSSCGIKKQIVYFAFCPFQGVLHFQVETEGLSWSYIFGQLERNRAALNIVDYSVSQTTLDQVNNE